MLTAIVVFVVTAPHGVGAWLIKSTHHVDGSQNMIYMPEIIIDHKTLAKSLARKKVNMMFRDSNRQWSALSKLWGKESSWDYQAVNPHSTAYGIAQILGTPRNSTIEYQVTKGLDYIVSRYDTPERAWTFWKRNGWY